MVLRQGHVRVLDFGLAQTFMAEPWISDMPIPPAATPAYASCERLVGDLPDVRDDIFSFACLTYELLSGKHPFGRSSAVEARSEGLKPRRIRGLSHRQWRALKRALAFSREDRPGSMQELLEGLALPSGTSRRSVRDGLRPRRGPAAPWPVAAMSLAVLGIIAALAWSRLPNELRASVGERAAATGSTLRQAGETARTWVSYPLGDVPRRSRSGSTVRYFARADRRATARARRSCCRIAFTRTGCGGCPDTG